MSSPALLVEALTALETQRISNESSGATPLPSQGAKTDAAAQPILQQPREFVDPSVLRKVYAEWKEAILGHSYDRCAALTKRLAQSLENCEENTGNEIAQQICAELDAHLTLTFDIGKWCYLDARIKGKDSADSVWRTVDELMEAIQKKKPPEMDNNKDSGVKELISYMDRIKRTEDFTFTFLHSNAISFSARCYEIGEAGKLFQIRYGQNGKPIIQEATSDQFRKCSSRFARPRNGASCRSDKQLNISFVLPNTDQVDMVLNERYLCFFAVGKSETLDKELLIKFDWKSCFDEPDASLAEFQEEVKSAKIRVKSGIFSFVLELKNLTFAKRAPFPSSQK